MLRAGNNSETMLILPNGRMVEPLVDPETGSSFFRGWRLYEVPIWDKPELATGFRRAPWLAYGAAFATLLMVIWCLWRAFERRRALLNLVGAETS